MAKLTPELDNLFANLEQQYNLPPSLLKSVAQTESGFNPNARNEKSGAAGMFQFMPATAKQYGVDVTDPESSAKGAAKMYSDLLRQNNGDLSKALAGYNWGQGNVQKKGLDKAPEETRNYISQITKLMGSNATPQSSSGSSDSEKKNEISDADIRAFNSINNMMAKGQQMYKDSKNQITDEDIKAFNQIQTSLKGATPQATAQTQISDADKQAFSQIQASLGNTPNPAPVQAPVSTAPQNPAQVQQQAMVQQPVIAQQQQQGLTNPIQAQPQPVAQSPQSSDQIGQALYSKITQIKDPQKIADFYLSRTPAEQSFLKSVISREIQKNPQDNSFLTNFGQGVAYAGQDISNSVEQAGQYIKSKITGDNSGLQSKDLEIKRQKALRELYDTASPSSARTVGDIAGQIGAAVIPVGGAIRATTLAGKALQYGLAGGAGAALSEPVQTNQAGDNFLVEKGKQAAQGAAIGAIAGPVVEKVIGTVAKPFASKLSPEDKAFQEAAKAKGITPLASELPSAQADQSLIKNANNLARDNKTVNEVVSKNQEASQKAASSIADDIPDFDAEKYIVKKGLNEVASDTSNPYSKQAQASIEKIKNVDPSDTNAVLKVTAEANHLNNKIANKLDYDEAARLAPRDVQVGLINTQKVLDDAVAESQRIATPEIKRQFEPVINNIKEAISKGAVDYPQADQLYKEFGTLARQATKAGDDNSARIYNSVRNAINKDKDEFVNALPDDVNLKAYKEAYSKAKDNNAKNIQSVKNNNQLRNLMEPYSKNGVPNLPDNLITNLIKKGKTEQVQTLFDSLDDEAKNAIQKGVLNKLVDSATTESKGFDPKQFNKAYKSYTDPANGNTPLDVVFDSKTAKNLKDTMDIFDNLHSIGYNKLNPQNGIQSLASLENLKKLVGLGGAFHSGGLSLAPLVASYLKKVGTVKSLTTPEYNRLLIEVRNTNPNSQKYIDKVTDLATFLIGNKTANRNNK